MAFICIFQLNNGAIKASDEVIFLEYIEDSFGRYHMAPIKIAKVIFNNEPAFIYSNSPSFPSSKGTIQPGDRLDCQTKIAYFSLPDTSQDFYRDIIRSIDKAMLITGMQ